MCPVDVPPAIKDIVLEQGVIGMSDKSDDAALVREALDAARTLGLARSQNALECEDALHRLATLQLDAAISAIDRLIAERDALKAELEWNFDMDAAPKDGSPLILQATNGRWHEGAWLVRESASIFPEGWYWAPYAFGGIIGPLSVMAWRPLPALAQDKP